MTRFFPPGAVVIGVGLLVSACTPTLNWREIQPEGGEVYAMFPCKPERFARNLLLAGDTVNMQMSSCVVDGTTYAVAYASVSEPGKVEAETVHRPSQMAQPSARDHA